MGFVITFRPAAWRLLCRGILLIYHTWRFQDSRSTALRIAEELRVCYYTRIFTVADINFGIIIVNTIITIIVITLIIIIYFSSVH